VTRGRARLALAAVALAAASPAAAGVPGGDGGAPRDRPVRITIAATGDLLIHAPVANAAWTGTRYDFRPLFRRIRPIIRGADLAICHAETPIGAGARSGYPLFNAPAALAPAIRWTGWDACSTASNHSVDRGSYGIAATLRTLHAAGVRTTGTARSPREARRILILRARGIRLALLSYTYGTNGLPLPAPWSVDLISAPAIARDARRARRRGADVVLANLHWGVEYVHAPTADQRRLARRLLRPGLVDVILGQHAHVVQPIARTRRGRFVVYGEGNLISAQGAGCCGGEASQDGLVALVRIRQANGRTRVTRVDYVPTRVMRPGYVVLPVGHLLNALGAAGNGRGALARELRASYVRTARIAGHGRYTRPLPRLRRR
jgi:poly-gamma-glutamate capsule biosynthesis protein CapA/YwtB (metallophosphatase superfamily)